MLTLNDGRAELWQWDTGRTLTVDADCSQVHFSNKVFGRSIDVDVIDGAAIIPDVLLQTDKDLNAWAFVGTAENGYTKISKTFKVNRRNKPADYVFTPTDQMTLQTIQSQIGDLADLTTEAKDTLVAAINEAARSGGGGGGSGLTTAQVNALDGMFKVCAFIKDDVSAEYNAFCTAFGIEAATITGISATYSGGDVAVGTAVTNLTGIVVTANYSDGSKQTVTGYTLSGTIAEGSNTITVTYEGMTTTFTVTGVAEEVTLTSISVTYSGGSVPAGTALDGLTGIVVTAHYSDGSQQNVTGYTLDGTIAEGSNTVTVTYQGKTATFTVTGVAESGVSNETTWTDGVAYTYTTVKDEYLETNGTFAQYNGWDRTPYLYCSGASRLRVVVENPTSSISNIAQYNGFFDENKNFISQFMYNTIDQGTVGAYVDVSVPADAVYFIASSKNTVITDYLGKGPAVSFTPYK